MVHMMSCYGIQEEKGLTKDEEKTFIIGSSKTMEVVASLYCLLSYLIEEIHIALIYTVENLTLYVYTTKIKEQKDIKTKATLRNMLYKYHQLCIFLWY